MGFKLSVTTKQNVTGEYWYIHTINFYKDRKEVVAMFHLVVDKASRDAGAMPLLRDAAKLWIQKDKFDTYFVDGVTSEACYTAAKAEGVISDYGDLHEDNVGLTDTFSSARKL